MLEKEIERTLVKRVQAQGGFAPKLVCPGTDGMPDRMVLLPGGRIIFVELKAPGKNPRPLQMARIRQLRDLGFSVAVVDGIGAIEDLCLCSMEQNCPFRPMEQNCPSRPMEQGRHSCPMEQSHQTEQGHVADDGQNAAKEVMPNEVHTP